MSASPTLLGIDLGGTKLAVAVIGRDGAVQHTSVQPHNARLADILDRITAAVSDLRSAGYDVGRVGLGVPGAVDAAGLVNLCPAIPDLAGTDIGALLRDRLGIPVTVENDANAAAVGEFRYGRHRDREGAPIADLASLCLGTGIGLGVISGGRLLRGAHGAAAEIADLRIGDGAGRVVRVEDVVEATALARAAGAKHRSELPEVLAAFARGEPTAVVALRRYCEVTARAIQATCALLDPALVVLSGGLGAQPAVVTEVTVAVARLVPSVRVVRSPFGVAAPVIGAAALEPRVLPAAAPDRLLV